MRNDNFMKSGKFHVIQHSQIECLGIRPDECIDWARQGFFMQDEAQMPAKLSVLPQGEDFITTMPCLLPERDGKKYFGVKLVSRIAGQIPLLKSEIALYDAPSGQLLAVMDGAWITAMRTGAVAALAAETFRRADVYTYSMMGLGNIARAVALCIIGANCGRRIIFRLLRYKDQAERFAERFHSFENVTFEVVDDRVAFVSEADILISCVTVSPHLLFPENNLFKKGVTLIPVHTRGFQNCDLFFDKVFGDHTEQIRKFEYFCRFRQYGEFYKVLRGELLGRTNDGERILSYNYGIALHDIVFAAKIYERTERVESSSFDFCKPTDKIWL